MRLPNGAPARLAHLLPADRRPRWLRPAVDDRPRSRPARARPLPAEHVRVHQGRGRRLQPAERSGRAAPRDPAGQQGHRGLELPEPVRLRPRPAAPEQQQLRAAGRDALPPPGARQRAEGAHLPVPRQPRRPATASSRRPTGRASPTSSGRRARAAPPGSSCASGAGRH